MRNFIYTTVAVFLLFGSIVFAAIHAESTMSGYYRMCKDYKVTRFEQIFGLKYSRALGCWLGERVND